MRYICAGGVYGQTSETPWCWQVFLHCLQQKGCRKTGEGGSVHHGTTESFQWLAPLLQFIAETNYSLKIVSQCAVKSNIHQWHPVPSILEQFSQVVMLWGTNNTKAVMLQWLLANVGPSPLETATFFLQDKPSEPWQSLWWNNFFQKCSEKYATEGIVLENVQTEFLFACIQCFQKSCLLGDYVTNFHSI